ncbi:pseudouridine synthase [Ancylobacter defluvii]|uniref:Pseudouridine synthase n=1 Tax=Ancylobacter defluvii TaxID=1282440 RepID=A0A9W6NA59_9HYPH|nr:pseudouridine synthase [Ancylobacter defluvii]MBS7590328.1 pseudouridine synthase [Ancylobacter defluvii]GLK83245.1 pseudouridine synthase [Ancylobacter defluvii]
MPKPPPRNPSAPRKEQNRVPRAPRNLAPAEPREAERVAKVIARAGLGSRREIEDWIGEGRVTVNGEVLDTPARTVTPEDAITVDGRPLPAKERTRLFLYHKPKGVVTTNFDPEGRPTLFEILPADLPRLVSVGRLDLNTEGLILLTNDGGLSRVLELPETGWLRRYRVRAKGEITQDKLDALINGITVDGVHYGPIEAVLDRVQGANSWLTLALREGKNREVRNVLGSLGLDVNRLIRLSYGPFQLGEIAQGAIEEVRTRVLADQLGPELTAAAGADFEGPVFIYDGSDEEAPRAPARSGKAARYAKAEGAEDRHRRKPIDTEETPERTVKAGIVADRKGRKVLVQRVKSNAPEPEPERAPLRGRRSEGDRPFRKREDGDRPARSPRREGEGGERTFRSRSERPEGDRPFRQREDGDRPAHRRDGDERPARGQRREESGQPFRARTERPRREEEGGERTFRPRSERPEGDRPFRKREDGDRPAHRRDGDERPARGPRREESGPPFRARTERPRREEDGGERPPRPRREDGERTERAFRPRTPREEAAAARPFRPRSEEGGFRKREEGDRPSRPRPPREEGERGERPFRPRGERAEGERPFRPRTERPEGDRPFRNRDGEERPERAPRREQGERPFRERSFRGEGSNRPYSGRVKSEEAGRGRSFRSGDGAERRDSRPEGKSFGGKSFGAKNFAGKGAAADKPRGERSFGDKPGGRPAGKFAGKPGGGKSFGGKPGGGKPGGGKPRGERPSGGPSKPRGPRPPRS